VKHDLKDVSFIVEGHDRTGKSTFIGALQRELPELVYHHFMFPKGCSNDNKASFQYGQFELMFDMVRTSIGKASFVFDRAHVGEYVWGPELREIFPTYMPFLEHKNKDLPIVLLFLRSSPKLILERLKEEKPVTKETIETVRNRQERFEIFVERSPFPNITIDTSKFGLCNYDEKVKETIELMIKDLGISR
jgi:thymidylate kinase